MIKDRALLYLRIIRFILIYSIFPKIKIPLRLLVLVFIGDMINYFLLKFLRKLGGYDDIFLVIDLIDLIIYFPYSPETIFIISFLILFSFISNKKLFLVSE